MELILTYDDIERAVVNSLKDIITDIDNYDIDISISSGIKGVKKNVATATVILDPKGTIKTRSSDDTATKEEEEETVDDNPISETRVEEIAPENIFKQHTQENVISDDSPVI